MEKYAGTTKTVNGKAVWTGKINFDEKTLLAPLKRKKPTMYFVNSMSDLFHEDVPDDQIDMIFAIMALCPQHTFQVLTKRADRMRRYFEWRCEVILGFSTLNRVQDAAYRLMATITGQWNEKRADERIPDLLATPAVVRWLSMEPLIGPVDMGNIDCSQRGDVPGFYWINALSGENDDMCRHYSDVPSLDWIVVGGESGPGARKFEAQWARSIRDQCSSANVPFFMKQMGGKNKAKMPPIPNDLLVREYPHVR